MTRKPPPKPAPSARKPAAARGAVAAAASTAHRKSAPVPARRPAALAAKSSEAHKKGAPAPKLTAAQAKSAGPPAARGEPRRGNGLPEDRQSQLKLLIARGKEQGYLTYAQVNDHLPAEIVDPEQIE